MKKDSFSLSGLGKTRGLLRDRERERDVGGGIFSLFAPTSLPQKPWDYQDVILTKKERKSLVSFIPSSSSSTAHDVSILHLLGAESWTELKLSGEKKTNTAQ